MFAVDTAPGVESRRSGGCSVAGHRRSLNEDSFLPGPTWFAVADGMGGHCAGDVASRLAIDVLRDRPAPTTVACIHAAVDEANESIRAAADRDGLSGMGTTLVGGVAVAGGTAVFHIGDSRCYRLSAGTLRLVTHDHSQVQELVDLGRITPEQARNHRLRNVVTRALGVDPVARCEVVVLDGPVGRLLFCSDGLTSELDPRTIGRVMTGVARPQAAADRLVELALRGAARDDVTALVVDAFGGRA